MICSLCGKKLILNKSSLVCPDCDKGFIKGHVIKVTHIDGTIGHMLEIVGCSKGAIYVVAIEKGLYIEAWLEKDVIHVERVIGE
jgi:hypothetical protein